MNYPVAGRTLKKWVKNKLRRQPAQAGFPPGSEVFTYVYDGSTCNNGGTPYRALLHVVLSGEGADRIIEDAHVEIPEDQREAASMMCAAPGKGADEARPFFDRLESPADFTGRSLQAVLEEEVPENFAGCFCGRPHINQKWKIALATIHYAIFAEGGNL